jgi:hypothetical protein
MRFIVLSTGAENGGASGTVRVTLLVGREGSQGNSSEAQGFCGLPSRDEAAHSLIDPMIFLVVVLS